VSRYSIANHATWEIGSTRASRRGGKAPHRMRRMEFESLEIRAVLSAAALTDLSQLVAEPAISTYATVSNPTPTGYTPAQIALAYGFSGITFSNGTIKGDGTGQTIAIVDAYNDPNIVNDLHVFDQTFGLSDPPKFTVVNQSGGTRLPATDAGWSEEIALDVEWAHAMAPGANILLVEANSASYADLLAAVNYARNAAGVSVVSMSWGSGEFSSETRYDSYFATPSGHNGVTFVASAGDSGAQATWPAISSNVLSVGGTSLSVTANGYASESAWNGSGGGYSSFESEPSYQRSVQTTGVRTSPDVSYDASPNTGFAVYDTVAINGRTGWFTIGGTSAGAPQWAALIAIADQGRALSGQSTLANAQSLIYGLSASDFHDVTSGSNGYAAKAGYDTVTGRGTPIASSVVRDLVANATSNTSTSSTSSNTTATQPTTTHTTRVVYEWVYWNHRWWLVPVTITNAETSDSQLADTGTQLEESALGLEEDTQTAETTAAVVSAASNNSVQSLVAAPTASPSAGLVSSASVALLARPTGSGSWTGGPIPMLPNLDDPAAPGAAEIEGSSEAGTDTNDAQAFHVPARTDLSESGLLLAEAVDASLADFDWHGSAAEWLDGESAPVESRELQVAVTAIALAVSAGYAWQPHETPQSAAPRPSQRRPLERIA